MSTQFETLEVLLELLCSVIELQSSNIDFDINHNLVCIQDLKNLKHDSQCCVAR